MRRSHQKPERLIGAGKARARQLVRRRSLGTASRSVRLTNYGAAGMGLLEAFTISVGAMTDGKSSVPLSTFQVS